MTTTPLHPDGVRCFIAQRIQCALRDTIRVDTTTAQAGYISVWLTDSPAAVLLLVDQFARIALADNATIAAAVIEAAQWSVVEHYAASGQNF